MKKSTRKHRKLKGGDVVNDIKNEIKKGEKEKVEKRFNSFGIFKKSINENNILGLVYHAIKHNKVEIFKLLLDKAKEKELNLDNQLTNKITVAIDHIQKDTDPEIVETLKTILNNNDVFLKVVCEKGNIEAVNKLLNEGIDINKKTSEGETPLIHAIQGRHVDVVELLLEKGAKKEARTRRGHPVIVLATQLNDIDMVKILVDKDADINDTDDDGHTAIDKSIKEHTKNNISNDLREFLKINGGKYSGKVSPLSDLPSETGRFIVCPGKSKNEKDTRGIYKHGIINDQGEYIQREGKPYETETDYVKFTMGKCTIYTVNEDGKAINEDKKEIDKEGNVINED
jgi:hypothetical protein